MVLNQNNENNINYNILPKINEFITEDMNYILRLTQPILDEEGGYMMILCEHKYYKLTSYTIHNPNNVWVQEHLCWRRITIEEFMN